MYVEKNIQIYNWNDKEKPTKHRNIILISRSLHFIAV
jgi:hypothetical protein